MAKKVNAGNKINWDRTPTKRILGFFKSLLKSSIEIPKATPNIIIAMAIFKSHNSLESKFILMASMSISLLIFKSIFYNI